MLSFKKFDFYLPLLVVFILGFGIAIIASVSPGNLNNLLLYIAISIIFFFLFSSLDIGIILPFSPLVYLFCLIFLITPFIFGTVTRGSVRWTPIGIGSFTVQPSELVKPFIALFASWFWSERKFSFKNLAIFGVLMAPALVLIFLQPDLGNTLVVLTILAGVVLYSGVKKQQLIAITGFIFAVVPLLWFFLKDYQKLRIVHFLNPYSDPLGEGYNLIQAIITVGSGGFLGRGLGRGTQSHLAFLPERHTDFIFASLAEELGFLGTFFVLVLYFLLLFKILKIARQQKERQYFLLTIALFSYLSFQIIVNVGMNIGLLPITGITLPLISYGGSSLLATMITLGMLENISRKSKREEVIEIR